MERNRAGSETCTDDAPTQTRPCRPSLPSQQLQGGQMSHPRSQGPHSESHHEQLAHPPRA